MPTLDQPSTARPPATWTGELVRQRLVEAFRVDRRLPGAGMRRQGSAWPTTPLHTWQDKVHWDDARERIWHDWENAKGAYPVEVSMMEEALDWLRYVPLVERRVLEAWAAATAKGLNVRRMIRGRWAPTTFYRQRDSASARIAERLNKQGVQVR